MKALLSMSEAARVLGVSRNTTLPAMIAAGVIRVVKFGNRVRVPAQEINRLCREGFAPIVPTRKLRVVKSLPAANIDQEIAELKAMRF